MLGGGGVDGAIHRAGGPAILEDCKRIIAKQGGCNTGEAVITTAGDLQARFVIHTVGPVWNGGRNHEDLKLASCYKNSLQLAIYNKCTTVAFPNISTGIYRFPKDIAAKIAVDIVVGFLGQSDVLDKVVLVSFDQENYELVQAEIKKR